MLVPAVRIRDDVRLPANEYVIKLRGSQIARAEVMPRFVLALDTGGVLQAIDGIETIDPSFGMPARWISPGRRTEAEAAGYVVVEATTMIATHLMETVKSNAADLLGRQDVQEMLETLKKTHPVLVDDVIPGEGSRSARCIACCSACCASAFRFATSSRFSRPSATRAELAKDPEQLTEHVRRALGNVIARLFLDESGGMRAIALGPRLEASLMGVFGPRNPQFAASALTSDALAGLLRELQKLSATTGEAGPVPLVVPPGLRVGVRRLLEPVMPSLPVVSLAELPPFVNLTTVALWEMKEHEACSGLTSNRSANFAAARDGALRVVVAGATAASGSATVAAMLSDALAMAGLANDSVEIVDGGATLASVETASATATVLAFVIVTGGTPATLTAAFGMVKAIETRQSRCANRNTRDRAGRMARARLVSAGARRRGALSRPRVWDSQAQSQNWMQPRRTIPKKRNRQDAGPLAPAVRRACGRLDCSRNAAKVRGPMPRIR